MKKKPEGYTHPLDFRSLNAIYAFSGVFLLRKSSRLRPSLLSLKSSVLLGENILGLKHTNRKKCSCIPLQISVSPGDSKEPKTSQNYKM